MNFYSHAHAVALVGALSSLSALKPDLLPMGLSGGFKIVHGQVVEHQSADVGMLAGMLDINPEEKGSDPTRPG